MHTSIHLIEEKVKCRQLNTKRVAVRVRTGNRSGSSLAGVQPLPREAELPTFCFGRTSRRAPENTFSDGVRRSAEAIKSVAVHPFLHALHVVLIHSGESPTQAQPTPKRAKPASPMPAFLSHSVARVVRRFPACQLSCLR